ncbi:MAG: glutamine-hydrolyzing carbamoyl-phosphate synthase small subunit [Candidatus Omnitrophica bacterium]|nr:glutamine-hydrolyzing carbamoyl-phosphate synthase small subunit [Candidatus Omnitrophota bacterium]
MNDINGEHKSKKAKIVLEDGRTFQGYSFGATGTTFGEVVFNTSMAGYQEILTDPSYKGQIVTMTYPLIGNYGVNKQDVESSKPFVEAFIVKECSRIASNWRSNDTLASYLRKNNIIGIEGVDTRALTRHIRLKGALKAVISTEDLDDKSLLEKVNASSGLVGIDLVKEVTCSQVYEWNNQGKYHVIVLDCGVKLNILRSLVLNNFKVTVVPAQTSAEDILKLKPDGLMLSNGPGDPEAVTYVIETVKKLLDKLPIFGICLGQQMLGLALGGKTYKLKFGHHGGNQPVKDLKTGKIDITVQNHGFCVDIDSLNKNDIEITHMNLNDKTLEGIRHKKLPIFSVQFHPESCPGPHDSAYLFANFGEMIKKHKK